MSTEPSGFIDVGSNNDHLADVQQALHDTWPDGFVSQATNEQESYDDALLVLQLLVSRLVAQGEYVGLMKKPSGAGSHGFSASRILYADGTMYKPLTGLGDAQWLREASHTQDDYTGPIPPGGLPPPVAPFGGGGSTSGSGTAVGGDVPLPTNDNPNGYLLTPQLGLFEDDLAYRMSLLCVNVLQPLKDKYPNIVVISGFRQTNSGIGQHELGEAVDLQIRNQTPELLYEVADYIQKFLNFDQVILNWTTIGDGQGWIHVSFSAQSLRNQVLTKDFADAFHEGLFLVDPLSGEAAAAALRDQATQDADILKELQNIQTRQTRQGTRPAAVVTAETATDIGGTTIGGGTGSGSGGLGPEVLSRVPGVIYPLDGSWSMAQPGTAIRLIGDGLLAGTFGQPLIDQVIAVFPQSGAIYYDKGDGKEIYAVTGFYTTLQAASSAWTLIPH